MPPKKRGAKAKKQQGGKAKSRGAGNRRNNPKVFECWIVCTQQL